MNRDWQICNSQLSRLCLLPPLLAIVVCSLSLSLARASAIDFPRVTSFLLLLLLLMLMLMMMLLEQAFQIQPACASPAHICFSFFLLPSRGNGAAVAVAAVGKHVNFDEIINTFLFLQCSLQKCV